MSEVQRELPKYRSHKEVWALKILSVCFTDNQPGAMLRTSEPGYSHVSISAEYLQKHQPHPGGYYVRYQDGYESFSPAEAFESGYTRI
jgi:hypothetical protein